MNNIENNFDWFKVDNLEPILRFNYPSSTQDRILEIDIDYWPIVNRTPINIINTFAELRKNLGYQNDNKIVIGYKRKDNGKIIYVSWYDSLCTIDLSAKNKDGAEAVQI